jgi:macrolide-specific efflux system membrane fusion protein
MIFLSCHQYSYLSARNYFMNTMPMILMLTMALPAQAAPPSQPVLPNCRVALIDDVDVSGREAGVLLELKVREGSVVRAGDELGRIDDAKVVVLRRVREKDYEAAVEQANNDISVRYADKAAAVALRTWQRAVKANETAAGVVNAIELDKYKLEAEGARLGIEKAQFEQKLALLASEVKAAEVEAADVDIQLRRIVSPIDGIVTHVHKHAGEWVAPGDPVVQVVRVDRLRVEGFVKASEFSPSEVANRPVVVETEIARGRRVQFPGKIVFVSPADQPGGEYLVWADVENRQENEYWLLRPGSTVSMTIDVRAER